VLRRIIILILLLFSVTSITYAQDKLFAPTSQYPHWEYNISIKVIILYPEDFKQAVDYYFPEDADKYKVQAFTASRKIDGKMTPIMYVKMELRKLSASNLTGKYVVVKEYQDPLNNNFGHELKHIINLEQNKIDGKNRFLLPCDNWK